MSGYGWNKRNRESTKAYIEEEAGRYVLCFPRLDKGGKLLCIQRIYIERFTVDSFWKEELEMLCCKERLNEESKEKKI